MSKKMIGLRTLIENGTLKIGDEVIFVSNPHVRAKVIEYELFGNVGIGLLASNGMYSTATQFVTRSLGMYPPDHALKWLKDTHNRTLWDLCHDED